MYPVWGQAQALNSLTATDYLYYQTVQLRLSCHRPLWLTQRTWPFVPRPLQEVLHPNVSAYSLLDLSNQSSHSAFTTQRSRRNCHMDRNITRRYFAIRHPNIQNTQWACAVHIIQWGKSMLLVRSSHCAPRDTSPATGGVVDVNHIQLAPAPAQEKMNSASGSTWTCIA